jgi:hypothetical protein
MTEQRSHPRDNTRVEMTPDTPTRQSLGMLKIQMSDVAFMIILRRKLGLKKLGLLNDVR